MLGQLAALTAQDVADWLERYNSDWAVAERDAMITSMRRIQATPDDPRYEAMQAFVALVKEGRLPLDLTAWLTARGVVST
jgi:hypothetical protein